MRKAQWIFTALLLSILPGCGGGSGGSGPFFGGVWRVSTLVTENTCSFSVDAPMEVILNVNQVGNEIAVQSESGQHYVGLVDGDRSFFASRSHQESCVNAAGNVIPGSNFTMTITVRLSNIADNSASARWNFEVSNCSGNITTNTSCRIIEEGRADRLR